VASQQATGQWTPGNDSDSFRAAKWDHLSFFLAIEQVVVVLHRDEACPAALFGLMQHLRKLPRPHGRGSQVTRFAGANDIMQSFQCLLDAGSSVKAMDLVKIDIICA